MKTKIFKLFVLFTFLIAYTNNSNGQEASLAVKKIWDSGKHNAFPDLIFAKGFYYVTFREGTSHVDNSNDGVVRIMRSKDFDQWEQVALFDHPDADVREARLSIMPDGRILVNLAVGLWKNKTYEWLNSFISFSDKEGKNFSPIKKASIDPSMNLINEWVWRVTWNNNVGYGILYRSVGDQKDWEVYLVKTTDGVQYDLISQIPVSGRPNESTIRFDNKGKLYAMIRREADDKLGVLSTSDFPYQQWQFNPLSWRLGGPNFLFLGKDRLVMGSRYHQESQANTGIFVTDLKGKLLKTIVLPSGGDNSYPGMAINKGKLHVVYYSSHEGKSAIYATSIPVKDLK